MVSNNLPLELTVASVELLADAATPNSSFITTAKDVGKAKGTFVLGVFNSELTDEQLNANLCVYPRIHSSWSRQSWPRFGESLG